MNRFRDLDDGTLVDLALIGEDGAFDELMERYESAVLEKAERIIGNTYSAEDIAQDTFFSAWEHLSELRYHSGFGTWILRIAENRAKTLLKHYKLNLQELVADMDSFPLSASNSVTLLSAGEDSTKLKEAIEALSHALRDTVRLHYIHGYSIKEISAVLSVPEGTVKRRLNEGRRKLRRGFGMPEDGNGEIMARVRRQITEIKRWAVKNDKTGFAETYEFILPLVCQMDETQEKSKMLADVLLRGMWWVPGQDNRELFEKIKASAIDGQNEEVMEAVVDRENEYLRGEEKVQFILDKQIPELTEAGFKKPLGSLYFWLGYELAQLGRTTESLAAFAKVISILPPSQTYYACAISALQMEKRYSQSGKSDRVHIACLGETYENQNGKWLFQNQYGYTRGQLGTEMDAQPMCLLSRCDGLLDDPSMKPGDVRTSGDGRVTLTLKEAESPVTVPAGTYEHCLIYETKGESYQPFDVETVVCPGIGIVKQTDRIHGICFLLTSSDVQGSGRIPLAAGNIWNYHTEQDGSNLLRQDEQSIEIIYATNRQVTASVRVYAETEYDTSTWAGNMAAARNLYEKDGKLCDVEQYLRRAEELASTPREKAHTAATADVMRRIFRTDPVTNPACLERGVRNYFKPLYPARTDGNITLNTADRTNAFEWKERGDGAGFRTVLYNLMYEITAAVCGVIWSDAWIPGFHKTDTHMLFGKVVKTDLTVGEDETVQTPAGKFASCRRITAETAGYLDFCSGHLEFWYAPGVGLVKFLRLGTAEDEPEDAKGPFVWELTQYRGTGEGYFPLDDGLLRRYEPTDQPLPDGYRGWVEYTYSTDETGTVIFKNACGVQERRED
ncbi:MAG: RNA polymerase sigma factor [Oscillospiraceae bacterium]|nr:RNA polymerase sigma factor [Oscillospiraceae bacterium]